MSKNDEKILELKKQIREKKNSIDKTVKFTPETNCILQLNGVNNNINVLSQDCLTLLMVQLNTYIMSAKNLELNIGAIIISGYSVLEWINDIKCKISVIKYKEEMSKLKTMELKLDKLLSEDKKTELEIDEIASLLQ